MIVNYCIHSATTPWTNPKAVFKYWKVVFFFSPNCTRTVVLPPPPRDEHGESNIFMPSHGPNHKRNFFELNTATYRNPRWWSLPFGWISFFPLMPYMYGPIFEKLAMPPKYMFLVDDASGTVAMPDKPMSQWLRLEQDLSYAVDLIRTHYNLPFIYPLPPSIFGYDKTHSPSGLHMAMRKARDWYVVWMVLLSYVIAQAESIFAGQKDSDLSSTLGWYKILQEHFDLQWLEGLTASTVYSFSPHTERAGVFLELISKEKMQPSVEWFYYYHVPVWYAWDQHIARNPEYSHLAPLHYQLQNSTTTITRSPTPHFSASRPPEHPAPKPLTWLQFLFKSQARYQEHILKETDRQKQVRLSRLLNPPKRTAKVFEWVRNSAGDLIRESVSARMREETLGFYPTNQIYYDPIENEYDCCEEYNSGAGNVNVDDNDIEDDLRWECDDADIPDVNCRPPPPARAPSPPVEVDDAWSPDYLTEAPDPKSLQSFISQCLWILRQFYGYTPLIPTPACREPHLKNEKDMLRFVRFVGLEWPGIELEWVGCLDAFQTDLVSAAADFVRRLHSNGTISDDEWDLGSGNRESVWRSTRIRAIRVLLDGKLFMFDFKNTSTVEWKVTVTTAAHALLVCRMDHRWKEQDIVTFFLQNGIPFHTLQLSHTLHRSPLSTLPPLVLPFRPANYSFTWRDYWAFRQQIHDILRQPRGRAALMRGYYPWRLALAVVGFSSVFSGPSGWSLDPEHMLVVRISETGEEFVDDNLTSMELKALSGLYQSLTGKFTLN